MKGVYFFIFLVFAASIVTAGCTTDRAFVVPEDSGLTDEEKYGIYDMESGKSGNETGPVEVTVVEPTEGTAGESVEVTVADQGPYLERAEGWYDPDSAEVYDSAYIVEYDDTEASEEDEYDYSIEGPDATRSSGNPLDAIKNSDEYSVQDNGTVTLNTDTGEITET